MQEIRHSSSVMRHSPPQVRRSHKPWLLCLVVLAMHAVVLVGMDAALTVGRLSALEPAAIEVAIVQEAQNNVKALPKKIAWAAQPNPLSTSPSADNALDISPASTPTLAPPAFPSNVATTVPTPEVLPIAVTTTESAAVPVVIAQPPPTRPVDVPPSTELRYKLIKGSDTAKASLVWRLLPNHAYELAIEATYFGFSALKQTSSGRIDAAGLVPVRYGDKRRGRSEQATHFEYDKKTIVFSNNKPQAALPVGTQDRVSLFMQLSGLFAAEPSRYVPGSVIQLPIANTDELEMWAFEVQSQELLALPIGSREAIKLTRRPRRAFDQTVELWLAPAEHYLPVRIRLTDSSGITDQQLTGRD